MYLLPSFSTNPGVFLNDDFTLPKWDMLCILVSLTLIRTHLLFSFGGDPYGPSIVSKRIQDTQQKLGSDFPNSSFPNDQICGVFHREVAHNCG